MTLFILGFVAVFVAAWLLLGLWGAGYLFAYAQGEFPELAEQDHDRDVKKWRWFIIYGPFALLTALDSTQHGWRFPK